MCGDWASEYHARALDATWRSAAASELIRRGQAVYVVGADPVDGLELRPATSFELYGGADPPWVYRIERAGPSSTRWHTYDGGSILHLRWQVDHARPWAGVSPMQRASDTGSLSGWLERRLSEEASGPVGAFLPLAKFDADPGADLDGDDDDPLAALRRDIGNARGQVLAVESAMAAADSPASAPRRDYQVQRFGADPPRDLVELREAVSRDIGSALGVPRSLLDSTASGQSQREAWRQFIATSVDGLCRRLEAQIGNQIGVAVAFDTAPLGGRDVQARAAAFRRLGGERRRSGRCRRADSGRDLSAISGTTGRIRAGTTPRTSDHNPGIAKRHGSDIKSGLRRIHHHPYTTNKRNGTRSRDAHAPEKSVSARASVVSATGRRLVTPSASYIARQSCVRAKVAYQKRRAAGVCVSCVELAAPGRVHCLPCGAALRKLTSAQRRKQTRLAAGRCPRCTGPLAFGRQSCADCLADQRAAQRERKARWEAAGLCSKCGDALREDPALRQCAHCRTRGTAYKKKYRADGLCSCGRFCAPGRLSCVGCMRIHRESQRRRRAAAKVSEKTG